MLLKDFMHGLATINPASIKPAKDAPSYKNLISDTTISIYATVYLTEKINITVYTNGYVTYSKIIEHKGYTAKEYLVKIYHTVFHINKMNFSYEFVDSTTANIDTAQLEDTDAFKILACYGETRLAHNQDSREEYHTKYHLDNNGDDWTKEANTNADIVEKQAMHCTDQDIYEENVKKLEKAKEHLTDKQLEVVQKVYYENKSCATVARELCKDRTTIEEHNEAALKKMKKYF